MYCSECQYARPSEDTEGLLECVVLKESPLFSHFTSQELATLSLDAALTGKFPYTTKDGQPVLEFAKDVGLSVWPHDFNPEIIETCKLSTLKRNIAAFQKI